VIIESMPPATSNSNAFPDYHLARMHDDPPPRALPERTGRHLCVRCLAPIPADEYMRNDHICDACAEGEEYPAPAPPPARNDER
jgi:hypothetical protein